MNDFLTAMLFLVVFSLVAWGMMSRRRVFEFPFHVGAVSFAFIIVQVPGLAHDPFVPEAAFIKAVGFLILCLLMCWFGWTRNGEPLYFFRMTFSEPRLLIGAAVLSVLGAYFYYALSRLPGEVTIAVQMTGVPVIYVFFSRLLVYGFAISVLCLARCFSAGALGIMAFDLAFIVDRIVRSGSRADTTELLMICALALWFYKRRAIPRWLALGGLVVGTLLMNSVGDYRAISKNNTGSAWQDIAEIDLLENTAKVWSSGGNEMRNAIQRVRYADEKMEFDYGLSHWNNLVFSFIPAQLVGVDVKSSLMISQPALARDYDPVLGTTETGLADAFQSFWYFGAVKFFGLAYIMRRIFASAEAGAFAAQFVYVMSVVPAMHAISHKTDWVLMVWVHMLLFAVPIMMFALTSRTPLRHSIHARKLPVPE
ncbi:MULTISPECIES: hypothetical protein [unclassified Rhizobium]|uniref:hypothetical protein n=1 Tax=unclassified Rhizobium TaxID=2613769 RepID=UPI000712E0FB|nr:MULTISPECIES: hypothetical protein [unclassified Rhizobium]KQT04761.1 hypothetical protein ASG50_15985 [Rhizobium sp. Leaf386]KQT05127.1 hypothetical protein ASG42_21640 [Rhizobium sp. Leaf391]KQU02113.1 hypothetical protein ASG68_28145 [Rhizobium sp. Leaf453]